MQQATKKKRKVYFDILRIIAIFFVLYAHTGELAIHHYMIEGGKASYWFALIMQQLSNINNSIFFFISGALLLRKEESIKDTLLKRVLKYVCIIIIFGTLQYINNYMHNPEIGLSFGIVSKTLYAGTIISSYWFLHTYLGLLLILPVLRVLVKGMSDKIAIYMLVVYAILEAILPIVEIVWDSNRISLNPPILEMVVLFPVLGHFFENKWYETLSKPKWLLMINGAGILSLAANVWYGYDRMQKGDYFQVATGLIMIMVITLFMDARFICEKLDRLSKTEKQGIIVKAFAAVGKATFVVYLLNNILLERLQFIYDALYLKLSWFGAAVLWLFACIVVGTIISVLYELIKYLLFKLIGFLIKGSANKEVNG